MIFTRSLTVCQFFWRLDRNFDGLVSLKELHIQVFISFIHVVEKLRSIEAVATGMDRLVDYESGLAIASLYSLHSHMM